MVSHKSLPQIKLTVTTGGTDYVIDSLFSGKIVRNENGFDTGTFTISDGGPVNPVARGTTSKYYPDKIAGGSLVKCEMKDGSETTWSTPPVFNGVARFVYVKMSEQGWTLELKCDGSGAGFCESAVGEEYGLESRNPTLDTIKEILTDANHGIIPAWTNKILGNLANASGYAYTFADVEDIAGSMKYVYLPFKPCSKAIGDVCDLLQAIKGSNAGPHWIVGTDDKFRLKTVGSDQAGWDDYYGGSLAASTLEEGIDFLSYDLQDLTREANYVLYHGAFRKPGNGDLWTENNAALWGVPAGAFVTLSNEGPDTICKVGHYSLKALVNIQDISQEYWFYPSTKNAGWDLTRIGGSYTIPTFSFWARRNAALTLAASPDWMAVWFITEDVGPHFYEASIDLTKFLPEVDKWYNICFGIGPNWKQFESNSAFGRLMAGGLGGDWTNINWIGFDIVNKPVGSALYIDGVQFNGYVLRGAKEAGIGANNKLKLKVITDDIGKDDTMRFGTPGTTDLGIMAQLAKAELFRCKTTPLVGEVRTPYLYDLLPGQLLHIHGKKKTDGTFNIDRDMRATTHELDFDGTNGFISRISVTSDVINSYPRMAWTNINKIQAAARPEFQDRQASSLKTREIDVTQTILEETY
jgi:hypothetical protein